jgi:hypothetical protein
MLVERTTAMLAIANMIQAGALWGTKVKGEVCHPVYDSNAVADDPSASGEIGFIRTSCRAAR